MLASSGNADLSRRRFKSKPNVVGDEKVSDNADSDRRRFKQLFWQMRQLLMVTPTSVGEDSNSCSSALTTSA
jgi:hypothetical protein